MTPPHDRRHDDTDESGADQRITPETKVELRLQKIAIYVVAMFGLIGSGFTLVNSLRSTDAQAASRITALENHLHQVATKSDLHDMARGLRLCIVQPTTCAELDNIGRSAVDYSIERLFPPKAPTP